MHVKIDMSTYKIPIDSLCMHGLGYSEGKAGRIMKSLMGKGVISYYRGAGILKVQFPKDPCMHAKRKKQYKNP